MLLVVGYICFLFSFPGDVDSLVPLIFWCNFPLSLLMVELSGLDWEVSDICTYIPLLFPPLEVGLSDLTPLEV